MADSAFIEIRTQQAAEALEAKLKALYHKDAATAINRAINRTLSIANTKVNKEIRSAYNIALADLNDNEQKLIKKSSEAYLTGTINANIMPLSLSKFNPTWTRDRVFGNRSFLTKTQKGRTKKVKRGDLGVAVEILKGHKEQLPSAFQLFKAGGAPVFARGVYNGSDGFKWGQARKPISKLNTKSIYFAIFSADIEKRVHDLIVQYYPERLAHEIEEGLKHSYK